MNSYTEQQVYILQRQLTRFLHTQGQSLQEWQKSFTTSQKYVSAIENMLPRYYMVLDSSSPTTCLYDEDKNPNNYITSKYGQNILIPAKNPSLYHNVKNNGIVAFVPGLSDKLRVKALGEIVNMITSLQTLIKRLENNVDTCCQLSLQGESQYKDLNLKYTEISMLQSTKAVSMINHQKSGSKYASLLSIDSDSEELSNSESDSKDDDEDENNSTHISLSISEMLQLLSDNARYINLVTGKLTTLAQSAYMYIESLSGQPNITLSIDKNSNDLFLNKKDLEPNTNDGTKCRIDRLQYNNRSLDTLCDNWMRCDHEVIAERVKLINATKESGKINSI